jgi:CHASE3 domain sensor protein
MSVSSRVILSIGVLMLLALGVLGAQLWTVVRMQDITTELSEVSFQAARRLLQMERQESEI